MVRLMAFWIVIVPLPIAFILPIRSGGCLYLLLFGWAMICARASCDLIAFVANAFVAHGQRIGLYRTPKAMSRDPLVRLLGTHCSLRTSSAYGWENSWLDCQDRSSLRVGGFIRTLY